MFVIKNRNDPELSEANFHAKDSATGQYPPNDVSIIILLTNKNIFRLQQPSRIDVDGTVRCSY